MAIVTHFLAAPAPRKALSVYDLELLVEELLQEELLHLPGAIYVGGVGYEPRFDDPAWYDDDDKEEKMFGALSAFEAEVNEHNYIVANDPIHMIARAKREQNGSWYTSEEKQAFLEALHRTPFGQQNVCLCFPHLGPQLQTLLQYWDGAAIYALTQPAFIDFVEPNGYGSSRLLERGLAHFFTMVSLRAAGYPDLVNNPLTPALRRCFGADLALAQTWDRSTWGPHRYQM